MQRLLQWSISLIFIFQVQAQLSIDVHNTTYTETFDAFNGSGFQPGGGGGLLNSNTWIVTGLSDGNLTWGATAATGDFARGLSTGSVLTGGVYAYDFGGGDMGLMVQPTGTDFTPGDFRLRILNNTGSTITQLEISYDLRVINDQNRSNTFNLEYSYDDITYNPTTSNYTSPAAATTPPEIDQTFTETLSVNIPDGAYFYLRWYSNDAGGGGSRDEFILNNVRIRSIKNEPDMKVLQGTTEIPDDTGSYDFGAVFIGNFLDVTFTIQNTGGQDLTIQPPTITPSSDFILVAGTFPITLPPGATTTFTIRFTANNPPGLKTATISFANNDPDENPYNFELRGTAAIPTGTATIVQAGASPEALTIPSTTVTPTLAVMNFDFEVIDDALNPSADTAATLITEIRIDQGTGNAIINWNEVIAGATLTDGINVANGIITANQIVFTNLSTNPGDLGYIADNTSKTYQLRIWLLTDLGTWKTSIDNKILAFKVNHTNFTVVNGASSQFATSADVESGSTNNRITVTATQFTYAYVPTTVAQNANFTLTLQATDAYGNVDLDANCSVTLSLNSGTGNLLSASGLTQTLINGSYTWNDLQLDQLGFKTLAANGCALPTAISPVIEVTNTTPLGPGDIVIVGVDFNVCDPGCAGGGTTNDSIALIAFKDIIPGTRIIITDNAYLRQIGPNLYRFRSGEGWVELEYQGAGIPAGTPFFVVFGNANDPPCQINMPCAQPVCATDWVIVNSGNLNALDMNTNSGDQVFILQGTMSGPVGPNNEWEFSGTIVFAGTTNGWLSGEAPPDNDGSATATTSYLPPEFQCLNIAMNFLKESIYNFSLTTGTQEELLGAITNTTMNWTAGNTGSCNSIPGPVFEAHKVQSLTIIGKEALGFWHGSQDNNWFNGCNWSRYVVPDPTIDATIPPTAFRDCHLQPNRTAHCKNLYITGRVLDGAGDPTKQLYVHGSLHIQGNGVLNMDDGNPTTNDGTIFISHNWMNYRDETAFREGNSEIIFVDDPTTIDTLWNAAGIETFAKLRTNQLNGIVEIQNPIYIQDTLFLEAGLLDDSTQNTWIHVLNPAANAVQLHNTNSYVYGKLIRNVNSNTTYDFPVGGLSDYELLQFLPTTLSSSDTLSVQFFQGAKQALVAFSEIIGGNPYTFDRIVDYQNNTTEGFWRCNLSSNTPLQYDLIVFPNPLYFNPFYGSAYFTIVKRPNETFAWAKDPTSVFVPPSNNLAAGIRRDNFTGFSDFTIAEASTVLPITFLYFWGQRKETAVQLQWEIALDNEPIQHFELLRSSDGKHFSVIATIPFQGRLYQYWDQPEAIPILYYQVRYKTSTGTMGYSPVIAVLENQQNPVVYPNPTKTTLYISGIAPSTPITIKVYNLQGKRLLSYQDTFSNLYKDFQEAFKKLSPGTYMVLLSYERSIKRFTIVKE